MADILRFYGRAATIPVALYDLTGERVTGLTLASGDILLSKDGAAFASGGSITEISAGVYELSLSAAEMSAARIIVRLEDQDSPAEFEDVLLDIETYGPAASSHRYDGVMGLV